MGACSSQKKKQTNNMPQTQPQHQIEPTQINEPIKPIEAKQEVNQHQQSNTLTKLSQIKFTSTVQSRPYYTPLQHLQKAQEEIGNSQSHQFTIEVQNEGLQINGRYE